MEVAFDDFAVREHDFVGGTADGVPFEASGRWLRVNLRAGVVLRLELKMKRYVRPPSYDAPYGRAMYDVSPIVGREV